MCRMLAVVGARDVAQSMCARFRAEAHGGRVLRGATPGHTDGWGIVVTRPEGLAHAGLSVADAAVDPTYETAVRRIAEARATGVTLAHVRKATLGAKTPENTHPFIDGGFAFCHNGTVHGVASPGQSDSRALFARLMEETRKGVAPAEAIASLARDVAARRTYTSLTMLLTDGARLWGLRQVGNDPVVCAPEACAEDYYTLGYAKVPGAVIVSQEHELMGIEGWQPIADGELLEVDLAGQVSVRALGPATRVKGNG